MELICVQPENFDCRELQEWLSTDTTCGAIASFVGVVRDRNDGAAVTGLTLEHYPGMTEKALLDIVSEARTRWALGRIAIVHRVGTLAVGDNIVFVGVASRHRQEAFLACAFIMDYLKTRAPFWKKEATSEGERWVDARESDEDAAARW